MDTPQKEHENSEFTTFRIYYSRISKNCCCFLRSAVLLQLREKGGARAAVPSWTTQPPRACAVRVEGVARMAPSGAVRASRWVRKHHMCTRSLNENFNALCSALCTQCMHADAQCEPARSTHLTHSRPPHPAHVHTLRCGTALSTARRRIGKRRVVTRSSARLFSRRVGVPLRSSPHAFL